MTTVLKRISTVGIFAALLLVATVALAASGEWEVVLGGGTVGGTYTTSGTSGCTGSSSGTASGGGGSVTLCNNTGSNKTVEICVGTNCGTLADKGTGQVVVVQPGETITITNNGSQSATATLK